jgi:hypothetical protein
MAMVFILGSLMPTATAATGRLSVDGLTVDNTVNPLSTDNPRPAFGWKLGTSVNSERQSAYRILVATDPVLLERDRPDVWDSGRVASDESVALPYGGPALEPAHRYYWAVEVWDSRGRSTTSTETAWWETAPTDWKGAQWISPDTENLTWDDFTLDIDFTIKAAAASVVFRAKDTANFYLWQINAAVTPGKVFLRPHAKVNGGFTNLGEIELTGFDVAAQHHLKVRAEGSTITTWIDGSQVNQLTNTALSKGTVGFRSSTTGGVQERAAYDNLVIHSLTGEELYRDDFEGQLEPTGDPTLIQREPEAPMLRRDFALDKRVAEARAYVYGLGFYELRLNGNKVGDRVLTPASTPYGQRSLFDTYDVTDDVRGGANAVGVWLGNGYGANYNQYGFRWLGPKQAIVLIDVTYTDGSHHTITTDPSWKWSTGAIVGNDIYNGETYDARLAQQGWDRPGFDDSQWQPTKAVAAPSTDLAPNTMPPIRLAETLRPIALTQPKPGIFIYDLGQNIAGWTRLTVKGPRGTAIKLRAAEELGKDGLLDTFTNRGAAATDTYVLSGNGTEVYEPRFTYHGFRYVELTGFPGQPTLDTVQGRAVHADLESTGTFESSSELLNQIWQNNRWSILNNSMSLPTDTPVRDERTPPTMDVQAYRDASIREFGMNGFYAKYLRDLPPGTALPSDAAKAQYPDMAGGQITLAWTLFEQYGDRATLAATYPKMKAFVDKNATDVPSHIWPADQGFGDWCPPDHGPEANDGMGSPSAGDCFSEVSLVNTALSYQQALNVAKAAQVVGTAAEVRRYTELADSIRAAFNEHFLSADGSQYGSGRQTTSVLPLAFGLVPDENVKAVGDQLVDTILTKGGGHLDTGIFGTRYLVDALAKIGRIDVAMTVLHQRTYPSFGFEIDHGATTSWEQWLYSSGMETHDHAMFAGINASLYTELAGIKLTSPAYRTVTIAPQIPPTLASASGTIETVRGRIVSRWTQTDESIRLVVTIPVGTTATVVLGGVSHTVGSGHWSFKTKK